MTQDERDKLLIKLFNKLKDRQRDREEHITLVLNDQGDGEIGYNIYYNDGSHEYRVELDIIEKFQIIKSLE